LNWLNGQLAFNLQFFVDRHVTGLISVAEGDQICCIVIF